MHTLANLDYHKCFHAHASTHVKYVGRRIKVHIVRLSRVMVLMVKPAEGVNWRMQDTEKVNEQLSLWRA